jgi:nitrogen fixation protein NifU and related proteins
VTAFRAVVLEHFRHPRNRGPLDGATASHEGANPLCGDRIRIQVRVSDGSIADARFTADACAICIASASVLTEHIRGKSVREADMVDIDWINRALEGEPPAGRVKCAVLPLDTLRRVLAVVRDRSS